MPIRDTKAAPAASAEQTGPSVAAKGPVDALGAPTGENPPPGEGKAGNDSDRDPFDALKDNLGKVIETKDDIARHEGGGGSGIQIRLGHTEH